MRSAFERMPISLNQRFAKLFTTGIARQKGAVNKFSFRSGAKSPRGKIVCLNQSFGKPRQNCRPRRADEEEDRMPRSGALDYPGGTGKASALERRRRMKYRLLLDLEVFEFIKTLSRVEPRALHQRFRQLQEFSTGFTDYHEYAAAGHRTEINICDRFAISFAMATWIDTSRFWTSRWPTRRANLHSCRLRWSTCESTCCRFATGRCRGGLKRLKFAETSIICAPCQLQTGSTLSRPGPPARLNSHDRAEARKS